MLKIKKIFFIIFLSVHGISFSINEIDSLKNVLKVERNDSLRIRLYQLVFSKEILMVIIKVQKVLQMKCILIMLKLIN
jgi:hypothetical protein